MQISVAFKTRDGVFHHDLDSAVNHSVMLDLADRLKLPRDKVIEWLRRYGSPREWLDAMLQEIVEGEALHKKVRADFAELSHLTLEAKKPDADADGAAA